mmetsp:Transcript_71/g.129  ORF Transcript_71/g.129 Transcript_71/m.129 type:complete len:241 (-) Transcript_71:85-807(-)
MLNGSPPSVPLLALLRLGTGFGGVALLDDIAARGVQNILDGRRAPPAVRSVPPGGVHRLRLRHEPQPRLCCLRFVAHRDRHPPQHVLRQLRVFLREHQPSLHQVAHGSVHPHGLQPLVPPARVAVDGVHEVQREDKVRVAVEDGQEPRRRGRRVAVERLSRGPPRHVVRRQRQGVYRVRQRDDYQQRRGEQRRPHRAVPLLFFPGRQVQVVRAAHHRPQPRPVRPDMEQPHQQYQTARRP